MNSNEFDKWANGKAIETARCLGIEVPENKVEKKLSEMKYGEKFIGSFNEEYYFIAKHPTINNRYIVFRERDNSFDVFFDMFYEMVE